MKMQKINCEIARTKQILDEAVADICASADCVNDTLRRLHRGCSVGHSRVKRASEHLQHIKNRSKTINSLTQPTFMLDGKPRETRT